MKNKNLKNNDMKISFQKPIMTYFFNITEKTFWPAHNHEFCELCITLEGDGVHCCKNKKTYLKKGSVYIIPIFTDHKLYVQKKWKGQNILFDVQLLVNSEIDIIERKNLAYSIYKASGLFNLEINNIFSFDIKKEDFNIIYNLIELINNNELSKDLKYSFEKNCMLNILYIIFSKYINIGSSNSLDDRIFNMLSIVNDNLYKPTSYIINRLALEYGISKVYLNNIVKKNTGISISKYIAKAKITEAVKLLKNQFLSIDDIAYKLNFYDTSHFYKSFKKYVNTTPKSFVEKL